MNDLKLQNNSKSAAITMFLAMAIIGTIDNFIAVLAQEISLWQFQIMRSFIAVPTLVVVAFFGFGRLRPNRWWAVALRSGLMAVAMVFYFGALALVPISHALAGLLTSPIFVVIFTSVFRQYSVGPLRYFAVLLGFLGTVLVLNISPQDLEAAVFVPLLAGVFYALSAIVTRDYCATESPVSMLAVLTVFQCMIGVGALVVLSGFDLPVPEGRDGFLVRGWVWPLETSWPWLFLQAFGSLMGVGLIIRSYQVGETSYVAIIEYSIFIFALGTAWILFDQAIEPLQIVGILFIVAAGAIVTRRM